MKCVRIVGQGVPCRLTNEKAHEIVEIDRDGEYCPKSFFKNWYKDDSAARERATDYTGKRLLQKGHR